MGGCGPLESRAYDGVVAMGNSTSLMMDCVIEACFIGAGRVRGCANMHLNRCLLRLCGYGIQILEESLLSVTNSILVNLTYGGFYTHNVFARSARVNLINSTIYDMPWVTPIQPKRTFESGMRYVYWEHKPKPDFGKTLKKAWSAGAKQNTGGKKQGRGGMGPGEERGQAGKKSASKHSGKGSSTKFRQLRELIKNPQNLTQQERSRLLAHKVRCFSFLCF
jgi:hypothetical protein